MYVTLMPGTEKALHWLHFLPRNEALRLRMSLLGVEKSIVANGARRNVCKRVSHAMKMS